LSPGLGIRRRSSRPRPVHEQEATVDAELSAKSASSLLLVGDFRLGLRIDQRSGANTLKSVHDHPVSSGQAAFDNPSAVDGGAECDLPVGNGVRVIDNQNELLVLVRSDRLFTDQEMFLWPGL